MQRYTLFRFYALFRFNPDSFNLITTGSSRIVAATMSNIGSITEFEEFFNTSKRNTNRTPDICPIRRIIPSDVPSCIGYATSEPCWKRIGATPIIVNPARAAMTTSSRKVLTNVKPR